MCMQLINLMIYKSPKPPWFLMPYAIFSLKKAGLMWYIVGRVNSRAHVLASGKGDVGVNRIDAGRNPIGGGYSAPVKKLSICDRVTDSGSTKSVSVSVRINRVPTKDA